MGEVEHVVEFDTKEEFLDIHKFPEIGCLRGNISHGMLASTTAVPLFISMAANSRRPPVFHEEMADTC